MSGPRRSNQPTRRGIPSGKGQTDRPSPVRTIAEDEDLSLRHPWVSDKETRVPVALGVAMQSLLDFGIGCAYPPPIQTDISQRIGRLMS